MKRGGRIRSKVSGRARPDEPLADQCEAGATDRCAGFPDQRHHVLPRSAGGTDAAEDTIDVCSSCHDWIHGHPAESYVRGWLRRRGPVAGLLYDPNEAA